MRKLLVVAAVFMLAAGCWQGLSVYMEYQSGQELYGEIAEQFTGNHDEPDREKDRDLDANELGADISQEKVVTTNETVESELPPEAAPEQLQVDWKGLKNINEDVVAWIQLPALDISYPVVQGEDNSYYLHRSVEKEELFSGCLFMDAYNDPELQNFNTIIYGHNMRDGSMFARLKEYDQTDTWADGSYFWIYTEQRDYLYRIFSSHRATVNGNTFTVRFADKESYISWLQKMKDSSNVESDVELKYGDKVVTLSTCTSGSETRQILQGVLVYQSIE